MRIISNLWHFFTSTLKGFDSPHQLALGLTLGMLIGLVPKTSAIPYLFLLITILSNANLLAATLSALTFAFFSPLLDPTTHSLGVWFLTFDPFESSISQIYRLPMAKWLQIENTVVSGATIFGLAVTTPIYLLSLYLSKRFGKMLRLAFEQSRIVRWLIESPSPNQPQESLQKS